jgi:hypothetical protein
MEIALTEYAERNHRNPATVRQKALRGGFKTARRVGRDWMIDEDEPYTDNRRLKAKDVFDRTAYGPDGLTAEERRRVLKLEQAKEYSGLRSYPSTCSAVFANIPDEMFDRYTAKQLGEIAALLKAVYDKGRYDEQRQSG